jgi:hypothetical protein
MFLWRTAARNPDQNIQSAARNAHYSNINTWSAKRINTEARETMSLPFDADCSIQIKCHNHDMMKNSLLTTTGTNSTNKISQSSNIPLYDSQIT